MSSSPGNGPIYTPYPGCTPPSDANLSPQMLLIHAFDAATSYCVPLDLILAIIGAETDYGRNLGTNNQGLGQLTSSALNTIEAKLGWRPNTMDHADNVLGIGAFLHLMYYGDCELGADGQTWLHYKPQGLYLNWTNATTQYNGGGYQQHHAWMPPGYREWVAAHLEDHVVFADGQSHGRCSIWDYFDGAGINQPWFAEARTPGLLDALKAGTSFMFRPNATEYLGNTGCHGQTPAGDVNCGQANYSWASGRP